MSAGGGYGICVSQTGLKLVLHLLDVRLNLLEVYKAQGSIERQKGGNALLAQRTQSWQKALRLRRSAEQLNLAWLWPLKRKWQEVPISGSSIVEVEANGEKAKSKTTSQA